MTEFVHRRKRTDKKTGKVAFASSYTGVLKLDWMPKRIEFSLKTKDKQVALKRLADMREGLERKQAGLPPKPGLWGFETVDLGKSVELFLSKLEGEKRGKQHIHDTGQQIRRLIKECKWTVFEDITPVSFEEWRTSKTLAAKTKNAYLIAVRSFLNWMVETRQIPENYLSAVKLIPLSGNEEQEPRAFTMMELLRFLATEPFYALAVMIGAFTGLRKSEIQQLVWSDVDLESKEPAILARKKTTKNRKSKRIGLTLELEEMLRSERPRDWKSTQKVLSYRIPRSNQRWKKDIEAAGIDFCDDLGRKLTFHSLRKFFITFMSIHLKSERMVQAIARHSDPKLTANIYTDVSQLDEFNAIRSLPPLYAEGEWTPQLTPETQNNHSKQSQYGIVAYAKEIAQVVVEEMVKAGAVIVKTPSALSANGGSNWARTSDLIDVNDAL